MSKCRFRGTQLYTVSLTVVKQSQRNYDNYRSNFIRISLLDPSILFSQNYLFRNGVLFIRIPIILRTFLFPITFLDRDLEPLDLKSTTVNLAWTCLSAGQNRR